MTDLIDRAEVLRVLERRHAEAVAGKAFAVEMGDEHMIAVWARVRSRFSVAIDDVRAIPHAARKTQDQET